MKSIMAAKWQDEFTPVDYPQQWLENVITIAPGESIQQAIDAASEAGGGGVYLKAGIHPLEQTLLLKSKVSLAGEGRERTILQ